MKRLQVTSIVSALVAFTLYADVQAMDEIVFAELGGVQLVSKPVDIGRDDYLATIVELRAVDPGAALMTFANISITGEVAQLHGSLTSAHNPAGNAFKESAGALYGEGWSTIDTHLLIKETMIAGGEWDIREANDRSYGDAGIHYVFDRKGACGHRVDTICCPDRLVFFFSLNSNKAPLILRTS